MTAFDTIVIGNDLGALAAAAILSQKGIKTALIRETEWAPRLHASGFSFDPDPLPWTGFSPGGIGTLLFKHLGIPSAAVGITPALQVLHPHHRIDIVDNYDNSIKEFAREFPSLADEIDVLFTEMKNGRALLSEVIEQTPLLRPSKLPEYLRHFAGHPKRSAFRHALQKASDSIPSGHALNLILKAEILFLTSLMPDAASPFSKAYGITAPFEGVFDIQGGKAALFETLASCITDRGGSCLSDCTIRELSVGAHLVNCTIDGKEPELTVSSSRCILSTASTFFSPFVSKNRALAKRLRRHADGSGLYHPFSLHLGVDERILPERLGQHALVLGDEAAPLHNGNAIHLHISGPGDAARAPDGKRALQLTTFTDFLPSEAPADTLAAIATTMTDNLRSVLPFLDDGIVYSNLQQSIAWQGSHRSAISPRYTFNSLSPLLFSPINPRTPYKNLFLAGPGLIPGMGFEGTVLTGINAALLAGGSM